MTVQNRSIYFCMVTFCKTYKKQHSLSLRRSIKRWYGVSYLLHHFEIFKMCSCFIYISISSSMSPLELIFPLRTLTASGDLCEGTIGILLIEAKDLITYPTMPRAASYNRELSGPKCQSIWSLLGEK